MTRILHTLPRDLVPLVVAAVRVADESRAQHAAACDLLSRSLPHVPDELGRLIRIHLGQTS